MIPSQVGRRMRRTSSSSLRMNSGASVVRPLPRLPVPDLRSTLKRYLKSLEPLLLENEARGGQSFQAAYDARARWADKFETGMGRVCQERLLGASTSRINFNAKK